MKGNRIREVWDRGECALNCWLSTPSTVQAKVIASQGFDSIVADMQHGYIDYQDLITITTAVSSTNTAPLVRVPWNEPSSIMKALDVGAHGVICPMINSRSDAEYFVKWCRYPPKGERSFGPMLAALQSHLDVIKYFEHANQSILAIAQIETVEALENLDDIVSVEGIDAVYVGPADLSISHGGPPQIDNVGEPSVARQVGILNTARKNGTKVCFHASNLDDLPRCIERAPDLLTVASDIAALTGGTSHALSTARDILAEKNE